MTGKNCGTKYDTKEENVMKTGYQLEELERSRREESWDAAKEMVSKTGNLLKTETRKYSTLKL